MMKTLRIAGFLGLLAFVAGAHADPLRPSMQEQIRIGEQVREQIAQEVIVLPETDPRVREVRRIGQRLVDNMGPLQRHMREFPYTFDVIEDDSVNAFAVPGGPVYIYTGLLDRFEYEDQVAGVLAHEIVHIRNQHWASAVASQNRTNLGVTIGALIFGANRETITAISVADVLLNRLPYSRTHEYEADREGLQMMVRAGYSPSGMIGVMETLLELGGSRPPEFISTHPDTNSRINRLREYARDNQLAARRQTPRAAEVLAFRPRERDRDASLRRR